METEKDFINLLTLHKALIYKVCFMHISNQEDLSDLYQEVVVNLWCSYPGFRNESKLSTWIYRVALNTCIPDLRKKKALDYVPLSMELGVYDDCLRYESPREIYRLIHQLDEYERMFVLLWLDENSYKEIVAITGSNRNTVAVRLHRIKEKLKKMSNQQKTDMELDELEQKWMGLSGQVEKNESFNRQIIIDMIQSKKKTYLQQQLRVEEIGFGVLGIFPGVVCYTSWRNVAPDWVSWYLLGMVTWLLVMQSLMFRIVYTLKTVTEHVEQQYRRLQSYRVLMNLTYIFAYMVITPVIIAFFCIWHNPLFRTTLCVMILAGFSGDYFTYHKTSDRLKGFREAVRSLQNLKPGGKE